MWRQVLAALLLAPTIAIAGVGNVQHLEGEAYNERDRKTTRVVDEYVVEMNDLISTTETGVVGILFEDNTTVTVIENSDLEIDDFIYDPADNTGKLAINVSVGTFRYVSGLMNKDKVAIITPTATITVRGTTLTGVIQQSGVTTVTLLPDAAGTLGSASVSNKAGSIDLTKPFHTVTVLSLTVAPPLPSIPSPSALKALGLMVDAVVQKKGPAKQEETSEKDEEVDEEEDKEKEEEDKEKEEVEEKDEKEEVEEKDEKEEVEVEEKETDKEVEEDGKEKEEPTEDELDDPTNEETDGKDKAEVEVDETKDDTDETKDAEPTEEATTEVVDEGPGEETKEPDGPSEKVEEKAREDLPDEVEPEPEVVEVEDDSLVFDEQPVDDGPGMFDEQPEVETEPVFEEAETVETEPVFDEPEMVEVEPVFEEPTFVEDNLHLINRK